ncbi:MAG TPA: di-heme oxidoredictase family protein [Thermoanaerobaculia bacterium]|nr:di-heme oxidoredictase family protein [Thermoanaerobaculia bacterium]
MRRLGPKLSWACLGALAFAVGVVTLPGRGQIAESAEDPTGVSIPYPLVHLVHAEDPAREGGTAQLLRDDPFLLYQLGRDLLQRQFRLEHGVYGRTGEQSVPLYVERQAAGGAASHGAPSRFARDHTASCGFCHSIPYREAGAGQSLGSTGGEGRNTPHFFGGGLIEMLAEQTRQQILNRYDANGNGVIDRAEVARPSPVEVVPFPGAPPVAYGDLSPGPDGVPRLNPAFRVWYLDERGALVPDALSLADRRVAAFDFVLQAFGWGRGTRLIGGRRVAEGGEASTLRAFFTGAADVHMGLQAHDPTQLGAGNGRARRSLPGAWQLDLGGSPDLGARLASTGISLDDPDGDGHPTELSQGDVDAAEWAMLQAPAPAVAATPESERGRSVLAAVGCQRCHVETWRIEARDPSRGLAGDRRFFDLAVTSRPGPDGRPELVGRLRRLDQVLPDGRRVPRGDAFDVERVYSDFQQWDLGPAFWERRFDGSLQKEHRTSPLWGVGSTAPYGHSGRFGTLAEVIDAHGGEAAREAAAWARLPVAEKQLLLAYLRSLVLYVNDEIPADVDGDGLIAERFEVGGVAVGYERFDPRFLTRRAPRYQSVGEAVDPRGRLKPLLLIANVAEVFGLDLPLRRDADADGFPDVLDPQPDKPGVADAPELADARP